MSRHVCFRCACGEMDFAASSIFTSVVWDDLLGALAAAGVDHPHRHAADDESVDGAAFLRDWDALVGGLEAARGRLPTLYQVWSERAGPDGPIFQSDAAYFAHGGRVWMVEGVYDALTARPLAPEAWEARRAEVPYDPPAAAAAAPELADALAAGAEAALTADAFERVFGGTPLTLEHGELGDFFAGELREAGEVARHAAERGEAIILYTY